MQPTDFPPQPSAIEIEILNFFADRNFERSRRFGKGAYDPTHLKKFLEDCGNPQLAYSTIHVAGTVAKGSTTTYLSRALSALGFKTGAYFSPHFVSLRERFCIDGEFIKEETLHTLWQELKNNTAVGTLSFFDAMTTLAFTFFAREKCDWAVIETGLGGRLDSTNNLRARIAVLTRIDLDHQNVLGDTLEKIAYEKAGIIHERQHVYSFAQAPSVFAVLKETAAEKNAHLDMLNTTEKNFIDQNRDYARQILKREFSISETQWEAVGEVLQKPIFGRLTQLSATPRIFFDSAHNAVSMHALAAFINTQKETHVQIFINTMTERDLAAMVQILRHTILQKVDFFLFPIFSLHYYVSLPEDSGISTVDDDAIRTLIARKDVLNFFTGSMGIYKELRERFNL